VAVQLGYCGLDRRRLPLAGTELRGCWEAGPVRTSDTPPANAVPDGEDDLEPPSPALRLRDFVPVELVRHRAAQARAEPSGPEEAATAIPSPDPGPAPTWSERVTLFADAEL
jgi:hypothetical protein